jgi:hypothetical protein
MKASESYGLEECPATKFLVIQGFPITDVQLQP